MKFLFSALLLISTASFADTINLSSADYLPFYGENLIEQGPVTKIVTEAFAAVGHEVNINFYPWERAETLASECKVDGMFPPWDKPKRRVWGLFSDAIPPANELVYYRHKSNTQVLSDLKSNKSNITVGIVNGYVYSDAFLNSGMKLYEVQSDLNNLRKLARQRIDLIIIDKVRAEYLIKTQLEEHERAQISLIESMVEVSPQHLVICKKAPNAEQKITDFNSGLKMLIDSGRVNQILGEFGLIENEPKKLK